MLALPYHELIEKLKTDEYAVDKELLETPNYLQIANDEAVRLGTILDDLKVDQKDVEIDLKTAEALVLIAAKRVDKANKPTADEAKAIVDSHEDVIALKKRIIQIQREIVKAKENYDRWYNLADNFKSKLRALQSYSSMIISGYVGYKQH